MIRMTMLHVDLVAYIVSALHAPAYLAVAQL